MDTLFHVRFEVVQRSKGNDARKVCAYQMCARMKFRDAHFDFRRKRAEHVGHAVLLPAGAPAWAADPVGLWQAAEDAERRGDAQPARLVEVAIPRAVPGDQRLAFARAVAQPWVDAGMCVQADVHCTKAVDGQEQPHAHFLLTMRRLDGDGFGKVKPREWSQAFTTNRGRDMRGAIADRMNQWMSAHGITATVDHRTYEAQGIAGPAPESDISRSAWKAHQADPASPAAAPVRELLAARVQRNTARRETAWASAWAAYSAAAAQHYEAERARRQTAYAERRQAEQTARSSLRARQATERDRVFRSTRRGLGRDLSLAFQKGAHDRQTADLHTQHQAARLTGEAPAGTPFPAFDAWIEERAAAGDQVAKVALSQRADRRAWLAKKDPQAAAARYVADAERQANRVLRTRPRGSVDDAELFRATRDKLIVRRDAAAAEAKAARMAVVTHWRGAGFWRRWTSQSWRTEHDRLATLARAARRRANQSAARHSADVRAARAAAREAAKANRRILGAWLDRADVKAAQAAQATATAVRAAVEAGDEATISAAAAGELAGAEAAAQAADERRAAEEEAAVIGRRRAAAALAAEQEAALAEASRRAAEARRQAARPAPVQQAPRPAPRKR